MKRIFSVFVMLICIQFSYAQYTITNVKFNYPDSSALLTYTVVEVSFHYETDYAYSYMIPSLNIIRYMGGEFSENDFLPVLVRLNGNEGDASFIFRITDDADIKIDAINFNFKRRLLDREYIHVEPIPYNISSTEYYLVDFITFNHPDGAILNPGTPVQMDFSMANHRGLQVTAIPYFQGQQVPKAMRTITPEYPFGSANAVSVRFTVNAEAQVDEVRLLGRQSNGSIIFLERVPVNYKFAQSPPASVTLELTIKDNNTIKGVLRNTSNTIVKGWRLRLSLGDLVDINDASGVNYVELFDYYLLTDTDGDLSPGEVVNFNLYTSDMNANKIPFTPVVFDKNLETVEMEFTLVDQRLPQEFSVVVAPNPVKDIFSARINLALPKSKHMTIVCYNRWGAIIETVLDEQLDAGIHTLSFNGNNGKDIPHGTNYYLQAYSSDGEYSELFTFYYE